MPPERRRPPPGTGARLAVAAGTAAYVGAVYGLLVLGGGALLGGRPPLVLAVLATALVAVTFEPWRRALSRRLRTTPYDVLADFNRRVAGAVATDDLAVRMARLLAEGTRAGRVEVWVRPEGPAGSEELAACWPPDAGPGDGAAVHRHEVVDGREPVGWIVREPAAPGDRLSPVEQRLLDDLLASAGVALRTLALTAGLRHRIEQAGRQAAELRLSRQRLVAAADAARRRVERDIHDGAQQHLVALAVNLSLASTVTGRDPVRARGLFAGLRPAAEAALDTLTELSSGIFPRLLAGSGPGAALRAVCGTSPVPVHLVDRTERRFPLELEATVYFACLEAVQNAVKHARAREIDVRLTARSGALCFLVRDDGRGFDPRSGPGGCGLANLHDRVESVGGSVTVRSAPGAGTAVSGRLPVPAAVPHPRGGD